MGSKFVHVRDGHVSEKLKNGKLDKNRLMVPLWLTRSLFDQG